MCVSTPSCSAKQSAEIQTALLQAITGLTQLVSQLATQFPTKPAAADAEPWMEERAGTAPQSVTPACTHNLTTIWDELSVHQLRNLLRDFPIDRSSLPAAIERLRRSELIEALNQIQAMDL